MWHKWKLISTCQGAWRKDCDILGLAKAASGCPVFMLLSQLRSRPKVVYIWYLGKLKHGMDNGWWPRSMSGNSGPKYYGDWIRGAFNLVGFGNRKVSASHVCTTMKGTGISSPLTQRKILWSLQSWLLMEAARRRIRSKFGFEKALRTFLEHNSENPKHKLQETELCKMLIDSCAQSCKPWSGNAFLLTWPYPL